MSDTMYNEDGWSLPVADDKVSFTYLIIMTILSDSIIGTSLGKLLFEDGLTLTEVIILLTGFVVGTYSLKIYFFSLMEEYEKWKLLKKSSGNS